MDARDEGSNTASSVMQPADDVNSTVHEEVLDNGLRVLIQEVRTAPLASVWCWARRA